MDMTTLDNRHALAVPYWARPGLRFFAKPNDSGTGSGGGDDEDDDDEDPDDEDDEDEDPDEGKTEDELRAELKAVRQSLGKANGSSAKRRKRINDLKAELDAARTAKPKSKKDDDDDELDVESIRQAARAEGEKAGNDRVKRAAVREALAAAGVSDAKARARLVGMVNLDDLDIDGDDVEGIDDAIDELKAELPVLFEKARRRRERVGGGADRDGKAASGPGKAQSASERQAAKLLGRQ